MTAPPVVCHTSVAYIRTPSVFVPAPPTWLKDNSTCQPPLTGQHNTTHHTTTRTQRCLCCRRRCHTNCALRGVPTASAYLPTGAPSTTIRWTVEKSSQPAVILNLKNVAVSRGVWFVSTWGRPSESGTSEATTDTV